MEKLAALGLTPRQVQGGPQGVPPGGGDDGVHLRVDGAAQLVPLAAGHLHGLPGAVAQVHAVPPPTGGAVVAGGDDLVVLHDDGPVAPAQAGGPLQHRLGDVQIVIFFVDALHGRALPVLFFAISIPDFPPKGKGEAAGISAQVEHFKGNCPPPGHNLHFVYD